MWTIDVDFVTSNKCSLQLLMIVRNAVRGRKIILFDIHITITCSLPEYSKRTVQPKLEIKQV